VADGNVFVVQDADNNIDTDAEIIALFGGTAFANPGGAADIVLLVQGSADTTVWYVDSAAGGAPSAAEVELVATLDGYTTAISSADLV